ncbi:hypothetical protein M404DRAFT_998999 [Pisolithus tinctorius Marx 270]|uniref:Uncharacterized protein n=1 Tax=Pisolithus tinctorius Marx 270 TaxID=870435 RepID=A0A0C3K9V0_PISTI|nr:hypothetical protein M404DRAFT_998999 [Pisolithus tinctorius Marx 270]
MLGVRYIPDFHLPRTCIHFFSSLPLSPQTPLLPSWNGSPPRQLRSTAGANADPHGRRDHTVSHSYFVLGLYSSWAFLAMVFNSQSSCMDFLTFHRFALGSCMHCFLGSGFSFFVYSRRNMHNDYYSLQAFLLRLLLYVFSL